MPFISQSCNVQGQATFNKLSYLYLYSIVLSHELWVIPGNVLKCLIKLFPLEFGNSNGLLINS